MSSGSSNSAVTDRWRCSVGRRSKGAESTPEPEVASYRSMVTPASVPAGPRAGVDSLEVRMVTAYVEIGALTVEDAEEFLAGCGSPG